MLVGVGQEAVASFSSACIESCCKVASELILSFQRRQGGEYQAALRFFLQFMRSRLMVSETFHQIFNLTMQAQLERHAHLQGSGVVKQEARNAGPIFGCHTIKFRIHSPANFFFFFLICP